MPRREKPKKGWGFSSELVRIARYINRRAPERAKLVMAGNKTLTQAEEKTKSDQQQEKSQEAQMEMLRDRHQTYLTSGGVQVESRRFPPGFLIFFP
jgi:hypothetical protein